MSWHTLILGDALDVQSGQDHRSWIWLLSWRLPIKIDPIFFYKARVFRVHSGLRRAILGKAWHVHQTQTEAPTTFNEASSDR